MALNNLDKLSEDAIKSLHNKRLGRNKKRTDLDIGLSNELVEECLKMDLNREREKKLLVNAHLVMLKEVGVKAKYPLVGHHCNPYDEAIEKNAIIPDVNFLISLDVSIWLADSETKPTKRKPRAKRKRKL